MTQKPGCWLIAALLWTAGWGVLFARAQETAPPVPAPEAPAADAAGTPAAAPADAGGEPAAGGESDHESVTPVSVPLQRLYEALIDVQDKEFGRAIPKLEWVIREDPTLLGAWEALGWSYWETGRRKETEDLWERLLKLAPNATMPHNLLAQVATQKKELVRAETLLRRSLELDAAQFETRVALARNLSWQGRPEDSAPLLRELLREDPERLDVRIELAHVSFSLQEYEEALNHWKLICEQIPDNPEFLVNLGRNHLFMGDLDEATVAARQALELDRNHLGALTLLVDIAEGARRPEQAVPEFRKLIDQTTDPFVRSRLRYRLAVSLRNLSAQDLEKYPWKEAIDECRRAIDDDPLYTEARVFMAELCIADRRYDEAKKLFEEVIQERNPRNLRAIRGLFEVNFVLGLYDDAERYLKQISEYFDPNDPYRYAEWARMEFARGRYGEAMRLLDRLEEEGARGAIFSLLYHNISTSEFDPAISDRLFREHIMALKKAGYRFVTPDQFAAHFKARPPIERPETLPLGNRLIRRLAYEFTGEGRPGTYDLSEIRPDKVVCVTFDDAMRMAFWMGTPIAEEFDVPFTMFVSVGNVEQKTQGIAQWGEIRKYRDTGYWHIGSHLYNVHLPAPVNEEGYLVNALPNRVWVPERKRLETVRAWFLRVRQEFQESRKEITRQLNMDEKDFMCVAYPYGDIGQENDSNVGQIENVIASILNESSMVYPMGFVQGTHGHATATANPLMYPRYEPNRHTSGADLVRHAMEQHPVFLARRLRAEMAALQGKPYLATRMLAVLERDGYPAEALRELSKYVEDHLANRVSAVRETRGDEHERDRKGLALSAPYLGLDGSSVKANRSIDQWEIAGRAGLNLTPQLTIEGRYGFGGISQEVRSNEWYITKRQKVTNSREVRTVVNRESGSEGSANKTTVEDVSIVSYQEQEVQTNRLVTADFEADTTAIQLRGDYRFKDGSVFSSHFGQKSIEFLQGEDAEVGEGTTSDEFIFGLAYSWKPTLALDVMTAYLHDLVPSARKAITYDAGALRAIWRVQDWWEVGGRAAYSFYEDDNSMMGLTANSFWLVGERQNFWLGVEGQLYTMDRESDMYWSPYWDERLFLVARLQRSYAGYFAGFEFRVGEAREKGRPEEMERWRAAQAPAEAGGWYAGASPEVDWQSVVGAACTFRRQFGRHWELYADASVTFFSEYAERNLQGGVVFHF